MVLINLIRALKTRWDSATSGTAVPIDAVVTYVDSRDPVWQEQRRRFTPDPRITTLNAAKAWRWESNDEGKYCLWSIRKFAPWIRKIFFVVAFESQVPAWLPRNDGNVVVVYHRDIFPKADIPYALPTFNSTAIEANLHRIPGLAECWLYFNDDCFLGRPLQRRDVMGIVTTETKPGAMMPRGAPSVSDIGYVCACKNANAMLDRLFPERSSEPRSFIRHSPQLQITSIHATLRDQFPEEFRRTIRSRFRSTEIHNTVAGLAEYYSVYNGFAVINNTSTSYIQVFLSDSRERNRIAFEYILARRPHHFNIQNATTTKDPRVAQDFRKFLDAYFNYH